MGLKSYDELRKIDVSPYCDIRDKVPYLNWAKCIDLLHKNGAEKVYWEPAVNTNGSSLILSDKNFQDKNGASNSCYETRIKIVIDDYVFEFQSPIMNGGNPVKDNSMTQARLWAAQCRAFVKAVAIHTGLGFDLWLKEEAEHETELSRKEDDIFMHDIGKIRERVMQYVTDIQKKTDLTLAQIGERFNKTEDEMKMYFGYYKILLAFENNIIQVMKKEGMIK